MIKVLQFGTLDVAEGGPALSTYLTIKGIESCGGTSTIIMPPPYRSGQVISESVSHIYTVLPKMGKLEYIPKMRRTIEAAGNVDIFHIQGLWRYIGNGAARYARQHHIPYIVTLRGMLYPQALAASSTIKKISLLLYQRKDLLQASCIQVTCEEELKYYRALEFTNPVAVIPNPIDLSSIEEVQTEKEDKFIIGYLGRIHPRKRIERLLYAMDNLRNNLYNAELIIIGSGDHKYEAFLKQEAERLNLNNVTFTGFLTGTEKNKAISNLSVLVVPSDFENFGNIVTEALVRRVPVIASTGTPWQELETHQCGWWINNDQESIDKTILKAFEIGNKKRSQMGDNGKSLIRNKYSVEVVGKQMVKLYDWVLGKTEKPNFIYTY